MADEFQSNILIGELTALNRYLKFKLSLQHYRTIKKDEELSQLRYENSMLRRGAGLPEATPSSSSLYTVQLESESDASGSDIVDDTVSPTMKPSIDSTTDKRKSTADELRRALHNLKLGFFARESDLNERLSVHKNAVGRMHSCNLDLKRDIREVCEHLCEDLNVLDDLLDVTAKMQAGVEERTRNSIGGNNSAPQSPTVLAVNTADREITKDTARGEEGEKVMKRVSAGGGSTEDDGMVQTNKAKSKVVYDSLGRIQGPTTAKAKSVVGGQGNSAVRINTLSKGVASTASTTTATSATAATTASTTIADSNSEQEVFISGLSVTERVSYFNSKIDFSLRNRPPSGRDVGAGSYESTIQAAALTTDNNSSGNSRSKKARSTDSDTGGSGVTGAMKAQASDKKRNSNPKKAANAPATKVSKPLSSTSEAKSSRLVQPVVDETMLTELYNSLLIRESDGEATGSSVDKTELTAATDAIDNSDSILEHKCSVMTVPTLRAFFLSRGENQLVVDECISFLTETDDGHGTSASGSSTDGKTVVVTFEQFVKIVRRLRFENDE